MQVQSRLAESDVLSEKVSTNTQTNSLLDWQILIFIKESLMSKSDFLKLKWKNRPLRDRKNPRSH